MSIYQFYFLLNLPPILLQLVELLSSVLMNWAEVYASRIMVMLARVTASALCRYSLWMTMRLTTHSMIGCWVRYFCNFSFARS
jgi:uncharacterized membrane protein